MLVPITIATFGDLLDHGYSLSVSCWRCGRYHVSIDIEVMAYRLGRGRSYIGWAPICRHCGTPGEMTVEAPGTADPRPDDIQS